MTLRIEIDCYCQYKCTCKSIPETKVTKQQIAYNLIRCNPALARYFSNHLISSETNIQRKQIKKDSPKPCRSIIEQKNLNFLLADKYPVSKPQIPKKEDVLSIQINNYVDDYAQTSPENAPLDKKVKKQCKKNPTEQQIREYYKQLKHTSRYLPNTSFKKYFNRPIFQNYGRQNTKGTNDGIIYGNYLKTHNINPHLGQNRPHDEETFYHALISANPQKLLSPDQANNLIKQEKGRTISLSRLNQNQSLEKPLKRHDNNPDAIIMDNIHLHNNLNKFSQTKISPKSHHYLKPNEITPQKYNIKPSPAKVSKSPRTHNTKSTNVNAQYVNYKHHIQPIKCQIKKNSNQSQINSPKVSFNEEKQHLKKISERKEEKIQRYHQDFNKKSPRTRLNQDMCPVDKIRQNHKENILSKQCHLQKFPQSIHQKAKQLSTKKTIQKLDFGPGSPKTCNCKQINGCKRCNCMKNIKKQLKQKADKDIELNNRLVSSARKATLYKNYSLNNVQNAKLDPHNYSKCCGTLCQQ